MENKELLDIIKCDTCDGLMRKSLINYKREYLNETITIESIEGYKCLKCGKEELSKEVINYVEEIVNVEELKIRSKVLKSKEHLLINKVKNVRQAKGLSQKELGGFLDSREQRYGVIERNTSTPTIIVEHLIASFLEVKTDDLYEMVFITPELYNKLLNIEIIDGESNNYKFEHVSSIEKIREELKEKRENLKEYNLEKRKYRNMIKKGELEKKEGQSLIKELDIKIADIKKIKDNKTNGLETQLKKLEGKHSMIIKQERVIDEDTWEKVKETYKEYF